MKPRNTSRRILSPVAAFTLVSAVPASEREGQPLLIGRLWTPLLYGERGL